MPSFSLEPPSDYSLSRDYCSYGYFLLEPSRWDVATRSVTRAFALPDTVAVVRISQKGVGEPLKVELASPIAKPAKVALIEQISRMLRLDEDERLIAEFHRMDPRWKKSGRGRLMRSPTFFEDVIKTVTSCNVTWPSTVAMNRRLCEALGDTSTQSSGTGILPVSTPSTTDQSTPASHPAFPTFERIAKTRPATLRARCRVGYRDQRIVELARMFRSGAIKPAWFEDPTTPDDDIREALLELPGIGPYAAANIMQLLGRYSNLPCDTETVRHGKELLGFKGSTAQVTKRVLAHFKPFGPHAFRSYWFEMWAHYEKVAGPAHTWEPRKTANTFTAATLRKAAADAKKALASD
jgi:3-methyladenine DNA glycosylase/8-oxoguanine DNA glycosylase